MMLGLAGGGTIVAMPRFDLQEFLGLVQKHRALSGDPAAERIPRKRAARDRCCLLGFQAEISLVRNVYDGGYGLKLDDRNNGSIGRQHRSLIDKPLPDVPNLIPFLPGRLDPAVGEANPGRLQGRFPVGQLREGNLAAGLRVQLGIRLNAFLMQGLGSFQVFIGKLERAFCLLKVGPGNPEVGFGLEELLLVFLILDHRHQLVAAHPVSDVNQELFQPPRDLRGYEEARLRNQSARKLADISDRALFHGRDFNSHGNPSLACRLAFLSRKTPPVDLPTEISQEDDEDRGDDLSLSLTKFDLHVPSIGLPSIMRPASARAGSAGASASRLRQPPARP